MMSVYIQSINQISAQQPLSDEWFEHPIFHEKVRVPSIDPKFSDYISPLMARRFCTLLKRDIVLSRKTLNDAAVEMPDAIISGTGLGCMVNTEMFLQSIFDNDEQCLQPSYFMQSTHNILSTTVAIDLKCHGYNNTYVNSGTSFENAVLDACMQFDEGKIGTALVGGYDELTDNYYVFFGRIGTWDFHSGDSPKRKCFAGEAAVSMLLGGRNDERTLCKIDGVEMLYRPTMGQLQNALGRLLAKAGCQLPDIDGIMTGMNTNERNDSVYRDVAAAVFPDTPLLIYKHLFGESLSSSALGFYAAVTCLHKRSVPDFLLVQAENAIDRPKHLLVYNHHGNKSHSFILLSSC